ncbi:hypothetical protein GGF42_007501 [Coemansia sp. RSA 2424]|nr:hypothetical protein GGF42_007501 [Coemansia sp. RSA 2424]
MNFGVDESKPFVPKAMLDAMYKFLFYEGNSFIGDKLQIRSGYERAIDPTAAAMFMHSATLESLQEVYKASEQPTQVVGTPMRDLSDARTPDPTPGVLTMPVVSELPPPPPQLNFGNLTLASNSIMDAEDPFSQVHASPPLVPAADPTTANARPHRKAHRKPPPPPSSRTLRSQIARQPGSAANSGRPNTRSTPAETTSRKRRRGLNKENDQPVE